MTHTAARLLGELGAALLDAGVSVTDVAATLNRAAERHGVGGYRSTVFTEMVMVTEEASGSTVVVHAHKSELTFAQAAAVNRLARRIERGVQPLGVIPEQVGQIRAASRTLPGLKWVVGGILIALGLAILFRCPWWAVALAAVAGGLVGVTTRLLSRGGGAVAIAPFVTAFVSTTAVGIAASVLGTGPVPLFAVCAPIAILVPGALITNALLELTATDIVTGSARLMYGLIVLGFMTAGIASGRAITGLQIDTDSVALVGRAGEAAALGSGWHELPPIWFSWVGVVILAVGIGLAFGSGRALTLVNVVMMTSAYAVLTILTPLCGNVAAIGITAATLFVAARLVERLTLAVPATVSFQPAFLLLVPGTIGLVALTAFEPAGLLGAVLAFTSLCIGTKVGDVASELVTRVWREGEPVARA
ncbi:threonine/serine exporter family protein [Leucobacter sp. CSA2]|uniref:Threonine/serine exporter family protein n=1 Tax=Leucobacter edaphi TaxID=2796472 RepID=A0A934QFD8_9MICO|nr:threonine/serine exporter family protein [Leucobacter edaphi]MBK0422577.1 threonine/serine exporter family protein [Leucobacter edaphi]